MGPRTTAAVSDFQKKENLTVTGQLDAETNARLMASAPPAASPATEPAREKPEVGSNGPAHRDRREAGSRPGLSLPRHGQLPARTSLNTREATSRASRDAGAPQ